MRATRGGPAHPTSRIRPAPPLLLLLLLLHHHHQAVHAFRIVPSPRASFSLSPSLAAATTTSDTTILPSSSSSSTTIPPSARPPPPPPLLHPPTFLPDVERVAEAGGKLRLRGMSLQNIETLLASSSLFPPPPPPQQLGEEEEEEEASPTTTQATAAHGKKKKEKEEEEAPTTRAAKQVFRWLYHKDLMLETSIHEALSSPTNKAACCLSRPLCSFLDRTTTLQGNPLIHLFMYVYICFTFSFLHTGGLTLGQVKEASDRTRNLSTPPTHPLTRSSHRWAHPRPSQGGKRRDQEAHYAHQQRARQRQSSGVRAHSHGPWASTNTQVTHPPTQPHPPPIPTRCLETTAPLVLRYLPTHPPTHPLRYTLCVSSQSGCAMACEFCHTGKLGKQVGGWVGRWEGRSIRFIDSLHPLILPSSSLSTHTLE